MTKLPLWRRRGSKDAALRGSGAGRGAQASPPSASRGFYERYSSLLPRREKQTVVILADAGASAPVGEFLPAPRAERVVVISPEDVLEWDLVRHGAEHMQARTLDEVSCLLDGIGPVDVILDLAQRSPEEYDAVWRRTFFHLRPRGLYAIDRRRSTEAAAPPAILDMASTVGLQGAELAGAAATDRPHRRSVLSVTVDGKHVLVTKRGRHLLKARDGDASRILPLREPDLQTTELLTIAGGTLTSAAKVHSHDASVPITALDDTMEYPEHHLRHYQGEIAMVANALLHTQFTALPDSFRHHLSANPSNPRLVSMGTEFARPKPRDRPRTRLPGNYYHLDSENSGHYGHLLTEVMSRLWGWDEAKRQIPDLKPIFRIRYPDERVPVLEQRIFGAYGIALDDIVWAHEPVWLESVVGATPMWHNQTPHYVHPQIKSVWDRIRDSLLSEGTAPVEGFDASGGRRIFVSRQDISTNRACRNTRDVEQFFRERGFDVVYPENHDLAAQAAIFDRAEVIAGFGGSAMFNIVFSRSYRTLILLNHEAYTARNEHLFTAVLGGEVHYFWSTPDVAHPPGGWSEAAYYSSWVFDFERNSKTLNEVIENLD